jgi:hypothetical protein
VSDAQVFGTAMLVGVLAIAVFVVAICSAWSGRLALPGAARLGLNRAEMPIAFSVSVTFLLLLAVALAWWPAAILLFFVFPSY